MAPRNRAASFVADPGTNFSVGQEPTIVSRLKALAQYLGENIYGISGYRSPAHSVAVGGFANDPHTRGEAADIGVGSSSRVSAASVSNATLARFGLYRPFDPSNDPSNPEVNHVQLLNGIGGAPSMNVPSYVPKQYVGWVQKAAQGTGMPAPVVAAQIDEESGFDPSVTSPTGAQGIAQFEPGTWKSWGHGSAYNPTNALPAYTGYMAALLKQYNGNIRNALAAYNAGPGNLSAGYGYADTILSKAGASRGATSGSINSAAARTRPGGGSPQDQGQGVDNLLTAYQKELTLPRTAPQGFVSPSKAGWTAPFQWWWQSFASQWQDEQQGI